MPTPSFSAANLKGLTEEMTVDGGKYDGPFMVE
jgi:hypothetical protein